MSTTIKEEILQGLPASVRNNANVTMSYQTYLQLIKKKKKTIYGEYADWTKCIEHYLESQEYKMNCHYVKRCEDIPIIDRNGLNRMLNEETKYLSKIRQLLGKGKECSVNKANILGIQPKVDTEGMFKWIINKAYVKTNQYEQIKKKFEENLNLVYMITDIMSSLFVNGFVLEFPPVGGVMTQQKGQYYYRGENAFYGSSKPSLYRKKKDDRLPKYLQEFITVLRRDECWNFLDNFDAVKHWNASSINYLALSQHYGLKTQMLDMTSNLKTALFFACCKLGRDNKWHPLTNEDIKYKNSRPYISALGGDSRYGIIYRCPTEINDMKWAISDKKAGFNIITPIGYQPFMRCSHQYGYMMLVNNESYDMMQDALFDKFRIRLDEDLCLWIYEEMGCGNAIYPHEDIPDIEKYIEPINEQHIFSEKVFKILINDLNIGSSGEKRIREELKKYGYDIRTDISYLSSHKLNKINKKYTADIAYSKIGAKSIARPILILSSDTMLEKRNGEYHLSECKRSIASTFL